MGESWPIKTKLKMSELQSLLLAYQQENNELRRELETKAITAKYAVNKLVEKEEENRKLKMIILRMSEDLACEADS